MALRRKKKHVAEVNMSSMTDIIFMLLIFFMLTSTLVKFLPFKLPESSQRTNLPIKVGVNIEKNGTMSVNGVDVTLQTLGTTLQQAISAGAATVAPVPGAPPAKPHVTIFAEVGVPFQEVVKVIGVAKALNAHTTLATNPVE